MSCRCSLPPRHAALNKDILCAFLVDEEELPAQCDTTVKRTLRDVHFSHVQYFNVFDEDHMRLAHITASRIAELSVDEMLQTLSYLRNCYKQDEFVDYIARVSLSKHGATNTLSLPPAHQTLPRLFFSSALLAETLTEGACTGALYPEEKVAWWREDPGLAEHHYNWHLYYPYTAPPRDRQGELFAYMHEQMLARYDFERLAVGLERVRAFGPGYTWDKPLKEGYNPRLQGFSFRPSGMLIPEAIKMKNKLILTDVLQRNKERFFYSLARGFLESPNGNNVEITMDTLGNTMEANMGSVNKKLYGNLHNEGHNVLAKINDPDGRYKVDLGPMVSTQTAPRDPVFYRWHKFVDAIFEAYREDQEPYKVEDMLLRGVEVESLETLVSGEGLVERPLTNNLYTYMTVKTYTIYTPEERRVQKRVLDHIPFTYCIRVHNTGSRKRQVVFRIMLAPQSQDLLEQWRNMFVEMDKFVVVLEAGETRELTRCSTESSVILPPGATIQEIKSGSAVPREQCGCGWPLNLLLPRGTSGGMPASLFVLGTDWAEDGLVEDLSGSVSYCGKQGAPYPDKRPMGFPFDRTTTFRDLDELANSLPNSALTNVTINFLQDYSPSQENVEDSSRRPDREGSCEDSDYVHVSG